MVHRIIWNLLRSLVRLVLGRWLVLDRLVRLVVLNLSRLVECDDTFMLMSSLMCFHCVSRGAHNFRFGFLQQRISCLPPSAPPIGWHFNVNSCLLYLIE